MRTSNLRRRASSACVGIAFALMLGAPTIVQAQVTLPSPDLPPEPNPPHCFNLLSYYEGIGEFARFPSGMTLSDPDFQCFQNVVFTLDPATGDETYDFDASMEVTVETAGVSERAILRGRSSMVVRGKGGSTTGSWQTEMISMQLSGDVGGIPIDVRESPGLPSQGTLDLTPLSPSGPWVVDSFFDIHTEISIAGGPFDPQLGPPQSITLGPVRPRVLLTSPNLPPEPDPANCRLLRSQYGQVGVLARYPSGLSISDVRKKCFTNVAVTTDPLTGDETQVYGATFECVADLGGGPELVELTGPVTVVTRGKGGGTTGHWQTEMVSMQLSGSVGGIPIDIRESPSLASLGITSVDADTNGGEWGIDSFFDVWTEVSVAGGPFQLQINPVVRLELDRVRPEAIQPAPTLPPDVSPPSCNDIASQYVGFGIREYPGGLKAIEERKKCFTNHFPSAGPGPNDETHTYDMVMETVLDDGFNAETVILTGPVQVVVRDKGSSATGRWETEMVSMQLSGSFGGLPIDVRESPSLPSPGETTITDIGGGQFRIDSFFDVFTEISIAGGPFQPQIGRSEPIVLEPIRPRVVLTNPSLPPEPNPPVCDDVETLYEALGLFAEFPNGERLFDVEHKCFQLTSTSIDLATGDETFNFDSFFDIVYDDGARSVARLSGPVSVVARGKNGRTHGRWETEMIAMSLTGTTDSGIPIFLRESPALPSLGETTVADADTNGGEWGIDSFFDVWTEISIAGGPFQPALSLGERLTLVPSRPTVILPSSTLPPEANPPSCSSVRTVYHDPGTWRYPGGLSLLDERKKCFTNLAVTTDPTTGDETQRFDAELEAEFDDGTGPTPIVLRGPVEVVTRGRGGSQTGRWETEMVSMQLSGTSGGGIPVEIRESPSLPSAGETTVRLAPGGQFRIDSFFDVFTEISIAGGPYQGGAGSGGRLALSWNPALVDVPSIGAPRPFALHAAAPNPFRPATRLSFDMAKAGRAELKIYDVAGRLVNVLADGVYAAGHHDAVWNGRDRHGRSVAAGVYLYKFKAGSFVQTKRMIKLD